MPQVSGLGQQLAVACAMLCISFACGSCSLADTCKHQTHSTELIETAVPDGPNGREKLVSFLEDVETFPIAEFSTRAPFSSRHNSTRAKGVGMSTSKTDLIVQLQRRKQSQTKVRLLKFLENNGFKNNFKNSFNINCRRASCFGLWYTYPLHEACKQKNADMVASLTRFGADPWLTDSRGLTAWDVAPFKVRQRLEAAAMSWQVRGFDSFFRSLELDPLVRKTM